MTFLCKHVSLVRCLVVSLALLGASAGLSAADAAPKPEEYFPDTTFAAFALPDLGAARKAAEGGRMGALFKQAGDPRVSRSDSGAHEGVVRRSAETQSDDSGFRRPGQKCILSGEIAVYCVYSHGPDIPPGVFVTIRPKDLAAFGHILDDLKPLLQDKPKDQPFALGPPDSAPGMMLTKDRLMVCFPITDMAAIADRIADPAKRTKGTL